MRPVVRIAYLCPSSELYGTEVSLLATCRALDPRRFRPYLIMVSDGPLLAAARAAGVETTILPGLTSLFSSRPLATGFAVLRLAAWLRRHRIAILEQALWWRAFDLAIPCLAAKLAGTRFVYTNRLVLPDWLTLAEKLWMSWADRIITVSRASLAPAFRPRRSDRLFRIDPSRVVVIPSCRDLRSLEQQPPARLDGLDREAGLRIVGMVAAIDPRKRQDIFLRAAAMVAEQLPEVRFVIVGAPYATNQRRGPAYRQAIYQLTESLGLNDRVLFTGFRRDAVAVIKRFDLLVLSSESEAEGSVLIEAMAVGIPVVASAVDGVPEIVTDGETGVLVKTREPREYAEAILALLKDDDRRRTMGLRAKDRAARFDGPVVTQRLQACYDALLR